MRCTCGIPNRANNHLSVIVGNDERTDTVDVYLCDEHTPNVVWGQHSPQTDPQWFDRYADSIHSVLMFDKSDLWEVIEYTLTELR